MIGALKVKQDKKAKGQGQAFIPSLTEWTPPHYILEESNFNFRYVPLRFRYS